MNTSYYAKYRGAHGISIAGKAPSGYKGKEYKKLAPKLWFFAKYKEMLASGIPEATAINFYTQCYQHEVLDKLDANVVYAELGEDAVLLCYEKYDNFCHRHLVAAWLEQKLGIMVKEL